MPSLTARDFHPEVMRLFDHYVHGRLDRRGFLDGASRHATGGMTALVLLEALAPNFAQAQRVLPDDARLDARFVEIDSPTGNGKTREDFVAAAEWLRAQPGVAERVGVVGFC